MGLQFRRGMLNGELQIDRRHARRLQTDRRQLVLRPVREEEKRSDVERFLEQNIFQVEDGIEVVIGSPEPALHTLQRVGALRIQNGGFLGRFPAPLRT